MCSAIAVWGVGLGMAVVLHMLVCWLPVCVRVCVCVYVCVCVHKATYKRLEEQNLIVPKFAGRPLFCQRSACGGHEADLHLVAVSTYQACGSTSLKDVGSDGLGELSQVVLLLVTFAVY
jgi:hypothetical protein